MHDLSEQVATIVTSSGIQTGTVNIFNVGSTAAVGTIEFEPGLERDLPTLLNKLIPPSREYGHEKAWHDGNGHSTLGLNIPRRIRCWRDSLSAVRRSLFAAHDLLCPFDVS